MKRYAFLLSIILCGFSLHPQTGNENSIVGIWKSSSENVMIKIDKVGDYFQGRIVWLNENASNQPMLDVNNPDKHRQEIPLKGNMIIRELSFNSADIVWEGGTFYHHQEGKLYNCKIELHSPQKMKIKRYVQNPQNGVAETWVRQ